MPITYCGSPNDQGHLRRQWTFRVSAAALAGVKRTAWFGDFQFLWTPCLFPGQTDNQKYYFKMDVLADHFLLFPNLVHPIWISVFFALQLNEIRVGELPIDKIVNESTKIVASPVLVVKVVCMLPYIHRQYGLQSVSYGCVSI